MGNQRNRKKGLFFEAKHDLHESQLGVKMCLYLRKRVLLDSIKGCLGVVFQSLPKISSKKACLEVNLWAKLLETLFKGSFFLETGNHG